MNLFRVLWETHRDVKEIKHSMADQKNFQAEVKKDLERLIQVASSNAVTLQEQALTMATMKDQIAALETQVAAGGGGDPAVLAELKAALADAQKDNADMQAGLKELDDMIEVAAPEPPTEPPPVIPAAS